MVEKWVETGGAVIFRPNIVFLVRKVGLQLLYKSNKMIFVAMILNRKFFHKLIYSNNTVFEP